MPIPEPKPGMVIRYDYLWASEAAARREHGKERPAGLVAATDSDASPQFVVIVPITHSRPRGGVVGIEIPAKVRDALELDDKPCWVIVSEHNVDEWPNAGLAPVPGRKAVYAYGFIPPGLFAQVKNRFLKLYDRGRGVRR